MAGDSMDKQQALTQIAANVASIVGLSTWRHMAARYNAHVYLVGSTLHNPTPRDYDIRVIIEDHEFAARYGHELRHTEITPGHAYHKRRPEIAASQCVDWDADGPTQAWIDDIAKFSAAVSVKLRRNMDIQIWPDSYWRVPYDAMLLAAPSPKWFFRAEPDEATT